MFAVVSLLVIARVGLLWLDASRSAAGQASDFGLFYEGARAWSRGGSFYEVTSASHWPRLTNAPLLDLAPPHFHLLMLPLLALSFPVAYWLWVTLNVFACFASFALISRELRLRWTPVIAALTIAAVLWVHASFAILALGQYGWLLMLPCTWAWIQLRHNRWPSAYAWLGLVMSIKPFPFLMVLWILWRGPIRGALVMGAVTLACVGSGALVFGPASYTAWMAALRQGGNSLGWMFDSFAVPGIWQRLLTATPWYHPILIAPGIAEALTTIIGFAIFSLATWRVGAMTLDAAWCFLWLTGFLISPLAWSHYAWMMIGPLIAVVRSSGWHRRPWIWSGLVVLLVPAPLLGRSQVMAALPVFAAMGLWVVLALARQREEPLSGMPS